ncbi:folate family ECF transporter S component [Breznakia pachnodae]|uniref:ECF transporter S component (Folate family) n=1 Tax=Breznakia pachnodae TaxID=265178 RepID=A0ABU0E386_9FIRM|nr:folate family ECF transporter S component [Breznakia pachnodae]MDQ0361351.1 ECF transporter S component (folate family) [Breznakia pachnodae]
MSMNAIISQVVCFLCLAGLFGYVFKKYPLKPTIKNLVLASLFVLLAVILNAISVMIPLFGVPSVKLSFALLPLMIAGAVLSPSWSYLVGLIFDLVGLMITPTSFPFLGFTLSHVLVSTLPSLWYKRNVKLKPQNIYRLINISFIVLGLIASAYVVQVDTIQISEQSYEITMIMKLAVIAFITAAILIIFLILYYLRKKMNQEVAEDLAKWIVVALLCEVLYSMILTPLWLDVMYGIPWWISTFIRIVKACVMIPLNIIVGYSVLKIVRRVYH